MQKFKDSQALDAMYKMAGMGDDDDEEEDDDEPKKRRRSEPMGVGRVVLMSCRQAH